MSGRGYAGKFAEIDLSTGSVEEVRFPDETLRKYVGGRGLGVKILWDRLGEKWDEVDPLGPENILLMLTGPLTGFFPGGRICITGKSPQSNGVVGSTIAGEFPVELKCAGWDGLIITGEAEKPKYILVKDSEIDIRDASHVWGKGARDTYLTLVKETRSELNAKNPLYGEWKEPAMYYIGPAGEKKVRTAGVLGKWAHGAGYGGYGAVMGSKKLKAVLVKGTGPLPEVADHEKTLQMIRFVWRVNFQHDLMRRWGTGYAGYNVGAQLSSEPVRNWQEEWHDERSFGVDEFERRVWVKRYWGDFGCPTTCLKLAVIRTGKYKGSIADNPDYELQAYEGTNLGIFTPEENVYMVSVIEELGFCGIQVGNTLGFAAELYQRGILTKEELGGLDLKWGNAEAFAKLAEMIAKREGIGDVLAEGTFRAALRLGQMKGQDLLKYAVTCKGIGIGAHGIRSGLDYPMGMSYACSVQGGDHTSVALLPITRSVSDHSMMMSDSGVYCLFNEMYLKKEEIIDFFNAVTGFGYTVDEWYYDIAMRIIEIQRALLLIGGPDIKWKVDDNPARFYEPLPSGPKKGQAPTREEIEKLKHEYYKVVGWDERGIPKSETLKKLGLEDVDRVLRKKLEL